MASKVIMPKLSPTMEEGQIARWLKKEGDKVSMGEPLAEIDTDKATMEMQALANGVLRKILVNEGESAPLGQLIAVIGEPDEDIASVLAEAPATGKKEPAPKPAEQPAPAPAPAPAAAASAAPAPAAVTPAPAPVAPANGQQRGGTDSGRIIVSPLAARMAADSGLDLRSIQGSGPNGRIVKRDIVAALP
ncbi:MAG TPA: biotin/lipoyl-containing protein, partial [Pyrinomonadaceae bacterium]|nr:biotin/lipoyl-containing protein [Pyrinomonadaceae bacterium]